MSRRTLASALAVLLILGLGVKAAAYPVKYVIFSPGPTINVLGKAEGKDVISVSGHQAYRDKGGLRMLTVSPTGPDQHVSLFTAVAAWISPDQAVYPYDDIYQPADTEKSVNAQSQQQMTSSQDDAIAAALTALKIPYTKAVQAVQVDPKGPAHGLLADGDLILAVDGHPVRTVERVIAAIRPMKPGSQVRLRIRHGAEVVSRTVTTAPSPDNPKQSVVEVTVGPTYRFPFSVDVRIDPNIGGPSAGMMFALGIYDTLTPGSLTHGRTIAGTGEITPNGTVGAIGGIQQKLVGAQDAGARLFLAPAANCAEALGGHFDPKKMRLVKVTTLSGAIQDVKTWAANPKAPLPECTK